VTAKPNTSGSRRKKPRSAGNGKGLPAGIRAGSGPGTKRGNGPKERASGKQAGEAAGRTVRREKRSKPGRTLEDVTMEAWEYTYRTRDRRLTKP
jgi:hypothetical protein